MYTYRFEIIFNPVYVSKWSCGHLDPGSRPVSVLKPVVKTISDRYVHIAVDKKIQFLHKYAQQKIVHLHSLITNYLL